MDVNSLSGILKQAGLSDFLYDFELQLAASITSHSNTINDPALRLLTHGGKRLRPILVRAIAGNATKQSLDAAVAIELAHVGTIIHDDIIDHSDTRWSQPTINSKEGVGTAIVVGDYLLAKSVGTAAGLSAYTAEIMSDTIAWLCEGQSLELADTYNESRSIDSYMASIEGKTAQLFAAACQFGAIAGGLDKNEQYAYRQFGRNFGMAFQIIDDLLDILAEPSLIGKPIGNDIKEGVYTYPILHGLTTHQKPAISQWLGKDALRPEATNIMHTLQESGSIEATITLINEYAAKADEALNEMSVNDTIRGLKELPHYYMNWALQTYCPKFFDLLTTS